MAMSAQYAHRNLNPMQQYAVTASYGCPPPVKEMFNRGIKSYGFFRSNHEQNPAVNDKNLCFPYEYHYLDKFAPRGTDTHNYSQMIAQNPEGHKLRSEYIGQSTHDYMKHISEKNSHVLPKECLDENAIFIDLGCGTAGALKASPSRAKLGIDLDHSLLTRALEWGAPGRCLLYQDLTQAMESHEQNRLGAQLPDKADFIHWGAPVTMNSEVRETDKREFFKKLFQGVHSVMNLGKENTRMFMGLPLNAIGLVNALQNDDILQCPPENAAFFSALKKYFDIKAVYKPEDHEEVNQEGLIGDAYCGAVILTPKSPQMIDAASAYQNLCS